MTQIALITGATAGIGAAAAREFIGAGWRVIATGRRADRLEALKAELGDAVHTLAFDVADDAATAAAIDGLPADWRDIDLLINNAGLALGTKPAQEARIDDWRTMIATNVTALVALTHRLLPGLIERQGAIINLSSVAATYPYTGGNVYAGTKAFVEQFSLGLRADLHGTGVRVTSIHGADRRRPGRLRRALQGRRSDDRGGYRRDDALGRDAAAASQHQPAGTDAGQPVLRRLPDRTKGVGPLLPLRSPPFALSLSKGGAPHETAVYADARASTGSARTGYIDR